MAPPHTYYELMAVIARAQSAHDWARHNSDWRSVERNKPRGDGEQFTRAIIHMETALRLLDAAKAPLDVGAHLDFATCRLREFLAAQ